MKIFDSQFQVYLQYLHQQPDELKYRYIKGRVMLKQKLKNSCRYQRLGKLNMDQFQLVKKHRIVKHKSRWRLEKKSGKWRKILCSYRNVHFSFLFKNQQSIIEYLKNPQQNEIMLPNTCFQFHIQNLINLGSFKSHEKLGGSVVIMVSLDQRKYSNVLQTKSHKILSESISADVQHQTG
ncbi:unnamed protein product [Paramecium octaurelia]|uniref:Uncharacterized protein n=1 Tax=Paramecium octaurelia TaxID=43137 RepID=A0A8S1YC76_PAROT|nr:unnamed protein product [Paramecium octaurelia]